MPDSSGTADDLRFMIIANNAADLYGALIVVGVMAHISIQVILNIAVVTNTIPNTGISLPFISYGGTSILFLLSEWGSRFRSRAELSLRFSEYGKRRKKKKAQKNRMDDFSDTAVTDQSGGADRVEGIYREGGPRPGE